MVNTVSETGAVFALSGCSEVTSAPIILIKVISNAVIKKNLFIVMGYYEVYELDGMRNGFGCKKSKINRNAILFYNGK